MLLNNMTFYSCNVDEKIVVKIFLKYKKEFKCWSIGVPMEVSGRRATKYFWTPQKNFGCHTPVLTNIINIRNYNKLI